MNIVKRFFANKDGKIVIIQVPNIPLTAWIVFMVLAKFIHASGPHKWLGYLSVASLLVWAVLEIGWGASYFRRTLGLVVLLFMVLSRLLK